MRYIIAIAFTTFILAAVLAVSGVMFISRGSSEEDPFGECMTPRPGMEPGCWHERSSCQYEDGPALSREECDSLFPGE